jgi:hypothetical protein
LITTYLSWRIAFLLEDAVILVLLTGIKLVRDVPYTGSRGVDLIGAVPSILGMGGIVLGILVWQEGGNYVAVLLALGATAMGTLVHWLVRRRRHGKPVLLDPDLFMSMVTDLGSPGNCSNRSPWGRRRSRCRSTCKSCSNATRWRPACRSPRRR